LYSKSKVYTAEQIKKTEVMESERYVSTDDGRHSPIKARYIALNVLADIGILALGFKFDITCSYLIGRRLRKTGKGKKYSFPILVTERRARS